MRLGGPVYCAIYEISTVLETYTIWPGASYAELDDAILEGEGALRD